MKSRNRPPLLRHIDWEGHVDILWAVSPLVLMATYLYGIRVLCMVGAAVLTARLCDKLAARLLGRPYDKTELSSVVHAILFTMLLPASAGYWVVVFGTMFMALVGKHAFGGHGKYPFNLTALAYAVSAVCWPNEVFLYPAPGTWLPLLGIDHSVLTAAASFTLKMGGVPRLSMGNVLLGNYAGPMGATFCLVLASCFVYLLVKDRGSWHIPAVFLATAALFAFAFPRVLSAPRLLVTGYEVFTGALFFAAVFIVNDPATAPHSPPARLIYGITVGILTMCYRYFGIYELGVCFAVLMANSVSPAIDRLADRLAAGGGARLRLKKTPITPEKEADGHEA